MSSPNGKQMSTHKLLACCHVDALADDRHANNVAELFVSGDQPFPVDSLPAVIRAFVIEAASAIGCDASYIVLPILASLAAAIGSTYELEIKSTWRAKSILWFAVVVRVALQRPLHSIGIKTLAFLPEQVFCRPCERNGEVCHCPKTP